MRIPSCMKALLKGAEDERENKLKGSMKAPNGVG
jgi:hypothetical protein